MKKFYSLVAFVLFISIQSFSQNPGDFRTVLAGNWNSTITWERYDGSNWITPAPNTPTNADGAITINHNVSVTADVTVDQVTFSNASILTISSGFVLTVADGTGNDLAWASTSSSVMVNGTLTINSGAVFTGSGGNGATNGALTVNSGGIVNVNGSISGPSSVGLVTTINAGGTMNISGTGSFNATRGNGGTLLSISGLVHVSNGGAIAVTGSGTMAVNSGGTLELEPTVAVGGNIFTLALGGNIKIGSTAGIASSGPTGNVQSSTRNFNTGANYEYNGTAGQVTGTGFPNNLTGNLRINNPGNAVSLSNARTIANTGILTLTSGLLTTTTLNMLTLASGASVSGGSSASFVNGPLTRNTNTATAYLFPVGKGSSYRPISILPGSSAASVYISEYFTGTTGTQISCDPSRLEAWTNNENWSYQKTSGADAQVEVAYSQANSNGNWTNGAPAANPNISKTIFVAQYNSGSTCWQDQYVINGSLPGNSVSGTLRSRLLTFNGAVTFGYGNSATFPIALPVTFGEIKGYKKNGGIQIDWTVYTEQDVDHYDLERSTDGKNFSVAGRVVARNATGRLDYGWLDIAPLAGTNFYRIKNVDIDNKYSYSIIIRVDLDRTLTSINIYPNPSNGGTITFQAPGLQKGNYTVKVMSASGQQVYSQKFNHNGGELSQSVPLPGGIKPGIYYLQVQSEERSFQKMFMIQ